MGQEKVQQPENAKAGAKVRAATSPKGRPRSFDTQRAVAAASTLFHARGYDRVTLADLTDAMGINPPSFYGAFGNKALLFKRIADDDLAEWLEDIRGSFDVSPSLYDALQQIITEAASRFAWRKEGAAGDAGPMAGRGGCLILESANNCSDALVSAYIRKARLTVAAALYRGIAQHAPDDVVVLTDHVMMLLAGLSAMAREGVEEDRLVPMAHRAATALGTPPHGR